MEVSKLALSVVVVFTLGQLTTAQDIACPVAGCVPGTPTCFIDPCEFATCPGYPEAKCCPDQCNCVPFWLNSDGEDVTNECFTCPVVDCVAGTPACDLDVCQSATCPGNPGAHCCRDPCNCVPFWLNSDGDVVTDECFPCPIFDCLPDTPACELDLCTTDCADDRYSEAICCENPCSCSEMWTLPSGTDVTAQCTGADPCDLVRCADPNCIDGYSAVIPEGQCCPVCRPTLSCPDSSTTFSSFAGAFSCPQSCTNNTDCPLHQMCCGTDMCGSVCVTPEVSCYDNVSTQIFDQGETFERDDCTTCECLRNGTIQCKNVCTMMCPEAASEDSVGICVTQCASNDECSVGEYCCENSCGGTVCRAPEVYCIIEDGKELSPGQTFMDDCNTCTCGDDGLIFCTEIYCPEFEYGCPPVSDEAFSDSYVCGGLTSSCLLDANSCDDDQLCCREFTGCAATCVEPVLYCVHTDGARVQAGQTYSSPYTCETCTCNGDSRELECTAATDACLRCELNGVFYPVDSPVPSDDCNSCRCIDAAPTNPTIECTELDCTGVCRINNGTYVDVGTSFAPDDCNTCTCTENGPVCTLVFCPPRCSLPQDVGDCDAVVPRYWYDQTKGVCTQFDWGGCGGNTNNFETIQECLDACDPQSPCLAPLYSEEPRCDALERKWTFDIEAGTCVAIDYSACQSDDGYNVYDTEAECQRVCITGEESECGDEPIVYCFQDPCYASDCPNFPEARCESNYCGGCNAIYYDEDGNDVTDKCYGQFCDDGSTVVSCFIDPCEHAECPNFPEAQCMSNFCGGCRAWFFDASGDNVTDRCRNIDTDLPTPIVSLQCPPVEDGTFGICVEGCSSNSNCSGNMLCCSNGCGRTCQVGYSIPYYELPPSCPERDEDVFTICAITEDSCFDDNDCEGDGQLCCSGGCGDTCQVAVKPEEPCFAVRDAIRASVWPLRASELNIFEPECTDDGYFAPEQCFNVTVGSGSRDHCWCVDASSGKPSSSSTCITCEYDEETYYPGQSFPSSDGCNDCSCSENGAVACTERACIERCEAPPDPGLCRAALPRYYFDYEDGTCKQFTYGGCGGNDNRFLTVADCLRTCRNDSPCLQPNAPGPCEAYAPVYFFNTTSDRCEQFVYGGCQGNDNNFPNGEACVEYCDPDGDYLDRCLGILCDFIPCPPGSGFVSDGTCCGGFCLEVLECRDDEMMCRDREGSATCVSERHICDIIEDCDDGSDERDCPEPPPDCDDGFLCGSTRECIPRDFVCDGYVDCRDRSDERDCVRPIDRPPNTWYIPGIPRECPAAPDIRCGDDEEDECKVDGDCDDLHELCCPTSCGASTCVLGQPVVQRCSALRRRLLEVVNVSIFVPNCEREGDFSPRQCFRGFCWCVDTQTGFPLTEGVRDQLPVCSGCQLRPDDPSSLIAFGDTYPADDGCNVCDCVAGWPEKQRCTNNRCPAPCRVGDNTVDHGKPYTDDCTVCNCSFGVLECKRRACTTAAPVRQPMRVTMTYDGDFDTVIPDNAKREDLEREVIRTLLSLYREKLGLQQDQIGEITVNKGSVVITVVLVDSEDSTDANVTLLLSQLEQDYSSGYLVIRFDGDVLEPSGSFQVVGNEGSTAFQPWIIAVIVVAALAVLVAVIAIIIAVVACYKSKRRGAGPDYDEKTSPNDYETRVTFTKEDQLEMVKVPLD